MKQFTFKKFTDILKNNGFSFSRQKGDHFIYIRNGKHVSIPKSIKSVVALRLIKENNLKEN